MLGRKAEIESLLAADESLIRQNGAHGIPLLAHSAFNGDVELFSYLMSRGAEAGVSYALHNAVASGHAGLTKWILERAKPDLNWKNYEGKTILAVAMEQENQEMQDLLRAQDAMA